MAFVSVDFQTVFAVTDDVPLTLPALASKTSQRVKATDFSTSKTLKSTSTPAVTKAAQMLIALSGGAASIDLTSLTLNGQAVTALGLKMIGWKVKNKGAASMTFNAGASNGIDVMGTDWKFTLPAGGGEMTYYAGGDNGPDVGSGDRIIDVAGTGTQEFEFSAFFA